MSATALPTYVDDGRACQIVRVSELLPGDVILGWGGEPFTLGAVESVERVARPTFSGEVIHSYLIHMTHQRGHAYVKGDDWRRIEKR